MRDTIMAFLSAVIWEIPKVVRLPLFLWLVFFASGHLWAQELPLIPVESQPLGANVKRVMQSLQYLGHPLSQSLQKKLTEAIEAEDSMALQRLLDQQVVALVEINPEVRVKGVRGPGKVNLQQHGFTPLLLKVHNMAHVETPLNLGSPSSGPVYAGSSVGILKRQEQTELAEGENIEGKRNRFLELDIFRSPPMTTRLSGLDIEYVIMTVSSTEAGRREALLQFDVGQGTQDLGFRGETPVLMNVAKAIPVSFKIRDENNRPSIARLIITDKTGRVYPSQIKRVVPDFFFQPQIYRADGEHVLLPAGEYEITYSRGPEYLVGRMKLKVTDGALTPVQIKLERWVAPNAFGFYGGDHHIHAAGCSHYTLPTEGVSPEDMFRQVKGEGLNVGCVLTWGPCYDHQRQFFAPLAHDISERNTLLKYDLEISGFGSAAMGHVCLLNLKNQTYPGSDGTKTKGWPTWTVPVLKWCKEQGGVTGYPHSALGVDPEGGAAWILQRYDANKDGSLDDDESGQALLPYEFTRVDMNGDQRLDPGEMKLALERASNQLPNLAIPAMSGRGAMEVFVSTPLGVCDFLSAMDTPRVSEWNTWYHLLNCGFPIKLSGETDFPCMSSRRVGQGRVYVQLGTSKRWTYQQWCRALAAGQSYVSDGYAHALDFRVNQKTPGTEDVHLKESGTILVEALVCFAPATPEGVAYGTIDPEANRLAGDTRLLHAPRSMEYVKGGERRLEVVVNGQVVAAQSVAADGKQHRLQFEVPVSQSSWVALRQFPQLHTNPV
ncbi:MAG: CehA/McbA family metallohydrolase, partial [Planctomycetota bacterium]|nr:CehA/McbA family metallohydrolase [Planctomycetota bacterium]